MTKGEGPVKRGCVSAGMLEDERSQARQCLIECLRGREGEGVDYSPCFPMASR